VSIGRDPWQVRNLNGRIFFKSTLRPKRVTALACAGRLSHAVAFEDDALVLEPATLYYLIER